MTWHTKVWRGKKKKKKKRRISWKVGDVLNNLWLFTFEHSVCMRASCKHPSKTCQSMPNLKNIRQWILKLMYRSKSLQTVRRTDGHSDDHLENMTSHTKVWWGIKISFRSVAQNTYSQGWLVFCGTERNKKKKKKKKKGKKDRFLEKSEMFLTIFDYSYLIIAYVCVQPVSIQARRAKDQCTCMRNLKNIRQ